MFTLITFIIAISILVFVHELGHYLAARAVGVKVLEFSIGFPPRAWGKKIGDTEYILSWIPVGGYVRLLGQDPEDENPDEEGNYASKTALQRLFILVAGAAMNLLFAWIFFVMLFMSGFERPAYLESAPILAAATPGSAAEEAGLTEGDRILSVDGLPTQNWREVTDRMAAAIDGKVELKIGRQGQAFLARLEPATGAESGLGLEPWVDPVIGKVTEEAPAERAGLMSGDELKAIDDQPVHHWGQITPLIQEKKGQPFKLHYLRDGRLLETQIAPEFNQQLGYWIIGLSQRTIHQSYGAGEAVSRGYDRAIFLTEQTFGFLGQLFSGQANKDALGGPIMIAQMVGKAAKNSLGDLLALMGFISLQLGIFNLFPFPALDGGHVLLLAIEKLKGGPLSRPVREKLQRVGFSVLMLLILYISIQDGLRLFAQ
ncbi:MAG: RIP metalloprotease RseP [bacterium]|nr:RIP metalloprotease RseP [bacterium]